MTITRLPVLVLNPYGRCNCRCAMCDIWRRTTDGRLEPEDLASQLEFIDRLGVEWVVFSGGEALMHPRLWELASMVRGRGIRTTLLSSGLLLHRFASRVVDQIDDVIVSLDGPPRVHDRIRGIEGAFHWLEVGRWTLDRLRPGFQIASRCTVQRLNYEHLCETVETANTLELHSISFLAADLASEAFGRGEGRAGSPQNQLALPDATSLARLQKEIEALIARGECCRFIRESPEKLRAIAGQFAVQLGLANPVAPQCNAPWNSAVIEATGEVRPCFFHRPIGNLNSGLPLDQILNGPEALAFRHSLNVSTNPVCRRCVCSLHWKEGQTAA